MANTVSLLSYANTFGDWVVSTNSLIQENNYFAANNYIKPIGTLYLNDPTLGLSVNNNAVFAGQLQVQGIGSSAYIQNNLRVDQQVFFKNTIVGLINAGQAYVNGTLYATNTGNSLVVSNNAVFGGSVSSNGVYDNGIELKTYTDTANVYNQAYTDTANNYTIKYTNSIVASNLLSAQNYTDTSNTNLKSYSDSTYLPLNGGTISGNLNIINALSASSFSISNNFTINGTTIYNSRNFILSANSPNQISTLQVYRIGTNASIRWNETNTYWDIIDVNNSNTATQYSQILTANTVSNSLLSNSTTTIVSSFVANTLNNSINTANTFLQSNDAITLTSAKSYTDTANTYNQAYTNTANTFLQSNDAITLTSAKSYTNTANTFLQSNDAITLTSAKSYTDTANTYLQSVIIGGTSVDAYARTKANSSVQTAFVGYTANGVSLIPSSNNDTLILTSTTSNGINVLANVTSKTIDIGLRTTGVVAGQYGNTTSVPTITVDNFGRVLTVSNNSIVVPPGTSIVANTGQITANASTGIVALGLALTGNAATYGNSTSIPIITTDSYGRITAVSNTAIISSINITDDVSTKNTYYPLLSPSTSGSIFAGNTSSSGLTFVPSTGTLSATIFNSLSDISLKSNIETISNALDIVEQLRGVTFIWNTNGQNSIGLVAQEVEKVIPEVVSEMNGLKTVSYDSIIGVLIEAIKELNQEIKDLKKGQ